MGDPSILRAGETDNQTMTIRLQPGNLATWSVTNNFLPGGNSLSLSTYLTYLPTHLCTSPEIQLRWEGGLFFLKPGSWAGLTSSLLLLLVHYDCGHLAIQDNSRRSVHVTVAPGQLPLPIPTPLHLPPLQLHRCPPDGKLWSGDKGTLGEVTYVRRSTKKVTSGSTRYPLFSSGTPP